MPNPTAPSEKEAEQLISQAILHREGPCAHCIMVDRVAAALTAARIAGMEEAAKIASHLFKDDVIAKKIARAIRARMEKGNANC